MNIFANLLRFQAKVHLRLSSPLNPNSSLPTYCWYSRWLTVWVLFWWECLHRLPGQTKETITVTAESLCLKTKQNIRTSSSVMGNVYRLCISCKAWCVLLLFIYLKDNLRVFPLLPICFQRHKGCFCLIEKVRTSVSCSKGNKYVTGSGYSGINHIAFYGQRGTHYCA